MSSVLKPAELRDYLEEQGQYFVSSSELCELLKTKPTSLHGALRRVQEHEEIINICPEGWVIAPALMKGKSAYPLPHPCWYVDAMMKHLRHPYYVGFARAASLWGGGHRRSYVVSVVSTARAKHRTDQEIQKTYPEALLSGVVRMRYVFDSTIEAKSTRTHIHKEPFMHRRGAKVIYSTPEVTFLDAVERPELSMGLDNVSNIACGFLLWESISPDVLAAEAMNYPAVVRQRAGVILETSMQHMGLQFDLAPLQDTLPSRRKYVPLFEGFKTWFPASHIVPDPLPKHKVWHVTVNGLLSPEM